MNRMDFSSIFFILATCVSLHDGGHAQYGCPPGFAMHGSKCYHALNQKASWPEAKEYCAVMGGDLASVTNVYDQAVISGIIVQNNGNSPENRYWIDGFYDIGWRWMRRNGNSVAFVYTNWFPGQPNNVGLERCTAALYADNGQRHDYPCDSMLNSICESSAKPHRLK